MDFAEVACTVIIIVIIISSKTTMSSGAQCILVLYVMRVYKRTFFYYAHTNYYNNIIIFFPTGGVSSCRKNKYCQTRHATAHYARTAVNFIITIINMRTRPSRLPRIMRPSGFGCEISVRKTCTYVYATRARPSVPESHAYFPLFFFSTSNDVVIPI